MRRERSPLPGTQQIRSVLGIAALLYFASRINWRRFVTWMVWLTPAYALVIAIVVSVLVEHYYLLPPPKQPIDFKHKVMAGDFKIDCYFCHPYAGVSTSAGMPSVQKCLHCHGVIRVGATAKLVEYQKRGEPIKWARVTNLPRYVRFNHECHIAAGHKCEHCHGKVETMDQVGQARNITMDFCVGCHRENHVSVDCYLCHY